MYRNTYQVVSLKAMCSGLASAEESSEFENNVRTISRSFGGPYSI